MDDFSLIPKEKLIALLAGELPDIKQKLSLTDQDLENMTGIGAKRLAAIESGRRQMKWSEYLSILFVLWENNSAKMLLDEKGLFPIEMKQAFQINRNAHSARGV